MRFLIYSVLDLIFKIYMNSYLYIELDNIEITKLFKYMLVELHLNILKLFNFFSYVPVRMFLFNYEKTIHYNVYKKLKFIFYFFITCMAQVSIHVAASHKASQHQTLTSQIQIVGPHAILA